MNSRERVLRALERESVDVVPHWVNFTSVEPQASFFGPKFFEADALTQTVFRARFLKSDIVNLPIATYPGYYDLFCERLYEGEDYLISQNPFGALHYWRKKPYFAKILYSPVRTKEDLKSIDPIDLSRFETKIETLSRLADALHERGYFVMTEIKGPFEAPWMYLRGFMPYMKDLVTDSGIITKMIELSFGPMMDLAETVIEQAHLDGILITDDLGERRSPFLSVDKYRRIYKPWHQKAVDRLHKYGVKVCLHSDGNVMPLVGEFVDAGFDSLDPLDPADNMRLGELKAQYGERITLIGGITREIGTMNLQAIDAHIQEVTREAGPYGLILKCGGGIPPEMTLHSFMHYCAAIERYRRL